MNAYVLGHSERELERLATQARMLEPFTRELLLDAGLSSGMRVLDVGSGVGDSAFLAAEIVGDTGEVIATDRSGAALAIAKERTAANSLGHVSFVEGDPTALGFDTGSFDAVFGRYVLMWQPDPAAMLGGLVPLVRAGGVIAFHELEWASARSHPPVPSWDRCCQLVIRAGAEGGADMQLGMKLHSLFTGAGLPPPAMRYASLIGASLDHVRLTTDIVATLLPSIERLGLAAVGEIDPETLAEDVLADVTRCGSIVVGRSDISAWSRQPINA